MTSIIWFRRDLRLADNPALAAALADGPAWPVFVVDPVLWDVAGPRRRSYLAASLSSLEASIRAIGGPGLTVLHGPPQQVLPAMAADLGARIFAASDHGPYGAVRDAEVARASAVTFIGSPFLHEPGAVRKSDGTGYRVFTPFYKAWRALAAPAPVPAPQSWGAAPPGFAAGAGWRLIGATAPPPFPVGEDAAVDRWLEFASGGLPGYKAGRDFPALSATSGLAPGLKYGEIHPRTIVADSSRFSDAEAFVRQLCWRDFYGHLLAELPATARANYQPAFDSFAWESGPAADLRFAAWAAGRTGFPFVDAGMRQLASQGTMPNRLRMVVASFLVKDLHIHWRRGARHFMHHLYDGDLANNQHGWQWTAGTGTDAAPYFRIFNPVTQGLRFDPDGSYVRTWVPELGGLPGASAHQPWEHPRPLWPDYPERIVDHSAQRTESMARYERIRTV